MAKKMTVEELVERFSVAHGDALEAVVLYGSAARHQGPPRGSIDLLVIVRALTDASLQVAGAATRRWLHAGHPAPLTLTSAEWRSSADVFAIEYADILAVHRVLFGTLQTEGIHVTRHNLRMQLEREVMGRVVQLRREMQARAGNGAAQRELLELAHGTIFALFRAALRLTNGLTEPHLDSARVAHDVAALVGFDAAPFLTLIAHRHGTASIAEREAEAVVRKCHDAMEKMAGWVDGVKVDGGW